MLRALYCITTGKVIRMEIANNRLRVDAKQAFEMFYSIFKGNQGLEIFHITDVVTDEGVVLLGYTECILEIGASSL